MKTVIEQARELTYSLGIPLYIRGDRIYQREPGQPIDPPPNAHPVPHGGNGVNLLPKVEPVA